MAEALAVLIVVIALMFFEDIIAAIYFVFSRIAEVIDILIDKLRGTGG